MGKEPDPLVREILSGIRLTDFFKTTIFFHPEIDKGDHISGSIPPCIGKIKFLNPFCPFKDHSLGCEQQISLCHRLEWENTPQEE